MLDIVRALYKYHHSSCYVWLLFPNTVITKQTIETIRLRKKNFQNWRAWNFLNPLIQEWTQAHTKASHLESQFSIERMRMRRTLTSQCQKKKKKGRRLLDKEAVSATFSGKIHTSQTAEMEGDKKFTSHVPFPTRKRKREKAQVKTGKQI